MKLRVFWIGLDWIGLDWIGLDWIGLDWIGLDWIGLDWIALALPEPLSEPKQERLDCPRPLRGLAMTIPPRRHCEERMLRSNPFFKFKRPIFMLIGYSS